MDDLEVIRFLAMDIITAHSTTPFPRKKAIFAVRRPFTNRRSYHQLGAKSPCLWLIIGTVLAISLLETVARRGRIQRRSTPFP